MYDVFQLRYKKLYRAVASTTALMVILLLFVLTACGANGSNTGSTGSTPPAATATPTSGASTGNAGNGNGTAEGCPSNASVSNPPKANEVVVASGNATVFAHPGDVIEIHLPFGKKWSDPAISSDTVTLMQPSGYADNASKACVWHFLAKDAGTAHLIFTMRPICKPGTMCPMYIAQMPVTITVK